jgi:uncharacterized phage protein gp47/JayE
VLGQIIGLFAAELALVWELSQQLYDARDPDQAEGEQQDNIIGWTGLVRKPATETEGTITANGTPGTVIPAGSIVRVVDNGPRFLTLVESTIAGGGSVDIAVEAEETGPVEVSTGTEFDIVTAVFGWSSVDDATADFETGQNVETDPDARLRREQSLQVIGAGPDQAIRARLAELDEVQQVVVFSNRTLIDDETLSPVQPGKSFRAVIWPDTADAEPIAQAIWDTEPAGIEPSGGELVVVIDDQGFDQVIGFSYAGEQQVHVKVTVTTGSDYPADGDDQIAAAVIAYGDTLNIGDDVILIAVSCAVVSTVPGILTAEILAKIGGTPGPGDDSNIAINKEQIATIDSGNVTVVSS